MCDDEGTDEIKSMLHISKKQPPCEVWLLI